MTQEEKQILFDDISRRLSCGVIVHHKKINVDFGVNGVLVNEKSDGEKELLIYVKTLDNGIQLPPTGPCDVLPYLRPMSSMTDEEKKEYKSFFSIGEYSCGGSLNGEEYEYIADSRDDISQSVSLFDWLNAHHFDYRNWIEDGLALEAPEDMYKTE